MRKMNYAVDGEKATRSASFAIRCVQARSRSPPCGRACRVQRCLPESPEPVRRGGGIGRERMVRRGSTVRVRQTALRKPRNGRATLKAGRLRGLVGLESIRATEAAPLEDWKSRIFEPTLNLGREEKLDDQERCRGRRPPFQGRPREGRPLPLGADQPSWHPAARSMETFATEDEAAANAEYARRLISRAPVKGP